MIRNRIEEGRVRSIFYGAAFFRDSPTSSKNRQIKAKTVPGFEPGSLGQNVITLPLAPPPLPDGRKLS